MNINNLFPTPVAFFKLDGGFTEKEKAFIKTQEQRPNLGNTTSKNNYLFKSPQLKRIAKFVDKCLTEYMNAVHAPKYEVEAYVTQSWANYTKPRQHHHKHAHPNSFISGCVYIAAKGDRIYFYKDGYQQIKLTTENYNPYNSESWWFEVNEGDVILFPSSLTHMVETLEEDKEERISIAFNTFLKGTVGNGEELTELGDLDGTLCKIG